MPNVKTTLTLDHMDFIRCRHPPSGDHVLDLYANGKDEEIYDFIFDLVFISNTVFTDDIVWQ